jgi:hypothetical protein
MTYSDTHLKRAVFGFGMFEHSELDCCHNEYFLFAAGVKSGYTARFPVGADNCIVAGFSGC